MEPQTRVTRWTVTRRTDRTSCEFVFLPKGIDVHLVNHPTREDHSFSAMTAAAALDIARHLQQCLLRQGWTVSEGAEEGA